jgi:hypothetical membrane protein
MKDLNIAKNKYRKFCWQIIGTVLLSVFLIIMVLSFVFIPQLINRNYFTQSVIIAAFTVSFLVVIISIYIQNSFERTVFGKFWPVFAVLLGITFGFIASILGLVFAFLISQFFNYVAFNSIGMSCFISLFCGFITCIITKSIFRLSQKGYLLLTALTFVIGFIAAVVLTHNQYWWHSSICALGMPANKNSQYYNFTLILLGALLILFVGYLKPQIKSLLSKKLLDKKKLWVLSTLYFLEMIAIALVGIMPYGVSKLINGIHMFLGFFVFYDIGMIMFLSIWIFHKFSRNFMIINYIILLIGTICYLIGFWTTLLPFTVTEVLTITTVIIWIILTLRAIRNSSN